MRTKAPKTDPQVVSFEPSSDYTWIRIKVVDEGPIRPIKRRKKHRPAWNVLGGLSASLFLPDQCGGKCGGGPK